MASQKKLLRSFTLQSESESRVTVNEEWNDVEGGYPRGVRDYETNDGRRFFKTDDETFLGPDGELYHAPEDEFEH
jgi:hypothetical protein